MVKFIDDQREVYGVGPICTVIPIASSTYYEQKAREADLARVPPRGRRDAFLREEIQRVWEENRKVYGARKVWLQLRREGFSVARCTVARLHASPGPQGRCEGHEKPHYDRCRIQ